jgi:hypothetical protein
MRGWAHGVASATGSRSALGRGRTHRSGTGTKHSKAAATSALLRRVASWLTRIAKRGGVLSRRGIGASVLRQPVAGCRPDYQRCAVKAVAIPRPKPLPLDPDPKLEGEFCKIVGGVLSPLLANVYLHHVYDLWVHQWRQRHAAGDVIVVRYADDTIVGFEHRHEAERFLGDLAARLERFGLALHPDKTRLIEFGRHAIAARRSRGLGKPETFDFLGFTHYCATRRSGTGFVLGRTPVRERMRATLRAIKDRLRATRHDGIEAQGRWLAQVLRGWLAYYAVPMSAPAITAFRHHLVERWLRAIRRRGQKHRLPWQRMKVIANRYLPHPRILHPWPEQRFLVTHPR